MAAIRFRDPWEDAEARECAEQPHVECAGCGRKLYAKTDYLSGDDAYYIYDKWWCEDCINDFKEEVSL